VDDPRATLRALRTAAPRNREPTTTVSPNRSPEPLLKNG
jgi:hypothetical protein